ncbi:MAG TPA: Rrf2 family transcriptional regulator, partial [Lapillicoccus sp.]|nr:Rrf2 family transcriptional regulator [Lapillicoccus sp.]
MDISARTDYAVRALLTLAAAQRDRVSSDEPHTAAVSVDVLVREQGLPRKFLEAILADLRRGGLVTSRR